MRLDYALYCLSVVLFAISAITFAFVPGQEGGTIYAISTFVVGVLCVGGGFFLRPRSKEAEIINKTAARSEPTVDAKGAEVQVQSSNTEAFEQQVAQTPQTQTPLENTKPTEKAMPPSTEDSESSKVEPSMNASLSPEVALPAPPAQAAIPGPVASPALEAIAADASNLKSNFSQIRGISEKRTEQLNSIGIYTIQQLANASPDDLAAKLNLSPRIVKMWIGTAKKMAK